MVVAAISVFVLSALLLVACPALMLLVACPEKLLSDGLTPVVTSLHSSFSPLRESVPWFMYTPPSTKLQENRTTKLSARRMVCVFVISFTEYT